MSEEPYVPERDSEGREIVRDENGERFPVSDRRPSPYDAFTPVQRTKMAEVYTMIAKALPVEGRDYSVSFSFPSPDGNPRISLGGRTEIGKAFVRHLYEVLGKRR